MVMALSIHSVNGILFEIPQGVSYFKFTPSTQCKVTTSRDVITFEYTKGITAGEFCRLAPMDAVIPDCVLISYLRPTKIEPKFMGVNKDKEFIKICHESITLTQLKYKIENSVIKANYYNLTVLLGSLDQNLSVDSYYNMLESTKLLISNDKVTDISELKNVEIHNDRYHEISSTRVYLPQSKYRQYRISALDYLVDFMTNIERIFDEYGFELVEYEKLKDAKTSNIVTFRINTHAREFLKRVHPRIPEHNLMYSGSRVSFALMTPDTDIYEDFRCRYNNIDLIQNLREFKCDDKYGNPWRYDCIWQSQLDDSFSHDFGTTDLGTYGYQFMFTSTLEFFDVYDVVYSQIEDILVNYEVNKNLSEKYENTQ